MEEKYLQDLKEIKQIMSRSSRFISLSGLSGIAAGVCALAGASVAHRAIASYFGSYNHYSSTPYALRNQLILIGVIVFMAAFISAFLFTYRKSKKDGTPIWGAISMRLLWNTLVPMVVGGVLIIRIMQFNEYHLIAPICLIFYGLGLLNGSKYTFNEIKYLGYCQIILGMLNLWYPKEGLYFWAIGFGVLHILYGLYMWYRYERNENTEKIN